MHVPKVISDNAILGQLGVNFVERILLNMGFVLHTTNSLEAGIDGFIELRDRTTGAASNFLIAVQIKATQQDFLKETPSTFEWVCTRRDLDYSLQGNAPVVLIVVRPRTDEEYWVRPKSTSAISRTKQSAELYLIEFATALKPTVRRNSASLPFLATSVFYHPSHKG